MTFFSNHNHSIGPARVIRRDFLRIGSLPAFGLGLCQFGNHRLLGSDKSSAKACILIWLDGGPSHLEMFDPKPNAPSEVRGPFRSLKTSTPDFELTELFQRTARLTDQCCLIRSMTSPLGEHNIANHYLLTGYQPTSTLNYPSFGAVVSHLNSTQNDLPDYIALNDYRPTAGAGFLGSQHEPYIVKRNTQTGQLTPRDLTYYPGLDQERMTRRREFLQRLENFDQFAQKQGAIGDVNPSSGLSPQLEQAYRMILNPQTRQAFDLAQESPETQARYGDKILGQCCLLARRLVESNVPFITIHNNDWDTHADLVLRLKEGYAGAKVGVGLIPTLDQAFSALIEDLKQRDLLDSTLVVVMGEFGRTPKINPTGGRDHWPRVFSVLLAGGGLKKGYVHGSSDRTGESPRDNPVTPADLACTIYKLLGISADTLLTTPDGRPIAVNQHGKVITDLLA